jgi:hypothetical protein
LKRGNDEEEMRDEETTGMTERRREQETWELKRGNSETENRSLRGDKFI